MEEQESHSPLQRPLTEVFYASALVRMGIFLTPGAHTLQSRLRNMCVKGGLVYKIRISSAGKDGVFDSLNNDDVVIEEAYSVRSAPESGCWQDGAQPF